VAQSIAERQNGFAAGGKAGFSTSTEQGWQQATITYPLWYALIDFYVRNASRYRLVLVFMGRGGESEKASILNSVKIPAS
jgi:hypothetical protein